MQNKMYPQAVFIGWISQKNASYFTPKLKIKSYFLLKENLSYFKTIIIIYIFFCYLFIFICNLVVIHLKPHLTKKKNEMQ